ELAAARTRSRVSGATRGSSRSARETVDWESPAARATSWLVTGARRDADLSGDSMEIPIESSAVVAEGESNLTTYAEGWNDARRANELREELDGDRGESRSDGGQNRAVGGDPGAGCAGDVHRQRAAGPLPDELRRDRRHRERELRLPAGRHRAAPVPDRHVRGTPRQRPGLAHPHLRRVVRSAHRQVAVLLRAQCR